jgi:hypothetical protein
MKTANIVFGPAAFPLPIQREYWSITDIATAYGYTTRYIEILRKRYPDDFPKQAAPKRYSIKAVRRFMERLGKNYLDIKDRYPSQADNNTKLNIVKN